MEDYVFTAFPGAVAAKATIDDSHCGGRGCCDEQVATAANVSKPMDWSQLIPSIAAGSFGLGMCCVWIAGKKRKSKKKQSKDDSDSD